MSINERKMDSGWKRDHFGLSVAMVTTKHQNMVSLLSEILFETAGQGPPSSKDFYQFVVTQKEVIWRWWKISLRTESRGAPPGEMKHLHQDFLNDSVLQEQIAVVFGSRILEYALALCRGHFDYLERLPDKLLLKILSYISLQDIGHMSQTSSRFRKLCNSDEIWKPAALVHCDINPEEIEILAKAMGWKNIFEFYFKKEHDSTACPAEEEDEDNTESP